MPFQYEYAHDGAFRLRSTSYGSKPKPDVTVHVLVNVPEYVRFFVPGTFTFTFTSTFTEAVVP